MKILKLVSLVLFVVLAACAGKTESSKKTIVVENDKTAVYYFHNTRRCQTCEAIESETKKVLAEQVYADAVKKGELVFQSLNAEDDANKELVKELGVSGSSLFVVKGGEKTDLTSKAFMYALKQPEKLQDALRQVLNN